MLPACDNRIAVMSEPVAKYRTNTGRTDHTTLRLGAVYAGAVPS